MFQILRWATKLPQNPCKMFAFPGYVKIEQQHKYWTFIWKPELLWHKQTHAHIYVHMNHKTTFVQKLTGLSDHLKWRWVQQKSEITLRFNAQHHLGQSEILNLLCNAGNMQMQCLT